MALSTEDITALRKIVPCQHCGGRHTRACPRVRSMQWHNNGALAGVEFWPAGRWPAGEVLFEEQLDTDTDDD